MLQPRRETGTETAETLSLILTAIELWAKRALRSDGSELRKGVIEREESCRLGAMPVAKENATPGRV